MPEASRIVLQRGPTSALAFFTWTAKRLKMGSALLTIFGLVAIGDAAAAEPSPELVAAAQAEGSFMLYASVSEPQIETLLNAFEEKFGIRGEYLRLVSATLIQRFVTSYEGGGNEADVFLDSSPTAFEMHPELFAALPAEELPNVAGWPKEWRGEREAIIQTSAMVVQYNTDLVDEADLPQKWTDILDPKWRGQISLTDPRISNTYLGWLDAMERSHGPDFVKQLGQQEITLVQSGAAGAQMVAAGSQALNFPAYSSFTIPLMEAGAPIGWKLMGEPQSTSQSSIALVKDGPHPNAAKLFVDWALSDEAIELMCKAFPLSTPGDLEGKFGCIALKDPEVVKFDVSEERRLELLKLLGVAAE